MKKENEPNCSYDHTKASNCFIHDLIIKDQASRYQLVCNIALSEIDENKFPCTPTVNKIALIYECFIKF
mgnify:CR=1 FL=1